MTRMNPEAEIADMQMALDELSASIITLSVMHQELSSRLATERRRLGKIRQKEVKPKPAAKPKKSNMENPVRTYHKQMQPMFNKQSKPPFDFSSEDIDLPGGRDLS